MKTIKRTINALLIIGLAMVFTTGCEKYEEGGLLKKADETLTQKSWKLDTYLRNGNDETSLLLISDFEENFVEGGILVRSYLDKDGELKSETGTWAFDNDKQLINSSGLGSIELTDETSTVSSSDYKIIKLKKDELWYFFENGGDSHEFHLVTK